MKKLYLFIFLLILALSIFAFVILTPRNYNLVYNLDQYDITEIFSKDLSYYKYFINYKDVTYPLIIAKKYTYKRQHIANIELSEEESYSCLLVSVDKVKYPICYDNNKLIDYRLASKTITQKYDDKKSEYNKAVIDVIDSISIYNYLDADYFIWNYKGYQYLSSDSNQTIKLIESDDYNNSLAYKIKNYLVTPNYDSKYSFKDFFVIDSRNLEITSIKSEREISYYSYHLGDINENIYFVDQKNKLEYKMNVPKKELTIIAEENDDGMIYNNKWETISLNKLCNNQYSFKKKKIYNYEVIDNSLYYLIDTYKILVTNDLVEDIIYVNDSNVYYIVNSLLYYYSPQIGTVKIMENPEWLFNYNNKIFIFD